MRSWVQIQDYNHLCSFLDSRSDPVLFWRPAATLPRFGARCQPVTPAGGKFKPPPARACDHETINRYNETDDVNSMVIAGERAPALVGMSSSCPSWQWHRTGYRWSPDYFRFDHCLTTSQTKPRCRFDYFRFDYCLTTSQTKPRCRFGYFRFDHCLTTSQTKPSSNPTGGALVV